MSSRGVNKAILLGRIGSDPKEGVLPNGSSALNFSLATSEVWKDKNTGQQQERTEWHKVSVFGKLAEIMTGRLHKGEMIYLEGKLRTRKWTKDGVDHYNTEIIADDIQFTGRAGGAPEASEYEKANGIDPAADFDDDIPF